MNSFEIDDTRHPPSEFHLCPLMSLDPEKCSYDWSFGYDDQYDGHIRSMSIQIFKNAASGSVSQDIWEVPPALLAVMNMYTANRIEKLQRNLRQLIGAAKDV